MWQKWRVIKPLQKSPSVACYWIQWISNPCQISNAPFSIERQIFDLPQKTHFPQIIYPARNTAFHHSSCSQPSFLFLKDEIFFLKSFLFFASDTLKCPQVYRIFVLMHSQQQARVQTPYIMWVTLTSDTTQQTEWSFWITDVPTKTNHKIMKQVKESIKSCSWRTDFPSPSFLGHSFFISGHLGQEACCLCP